MLDDALPLAEAVAVPSPPVELALEALLDEAGMRAVADESSVDEREAVAETNVSAGEDGVSVAGPLSAGAEGDSTAAKVVGAAAATDGVVGLVDKEDAEDAGCV